MKLAQLYQFVAVSESGTITLAAKNLHISQQSLSESLLKLEEEYQSQFFLRRPKGVLLTEDGQIFLAQAEKILAEVDNLEKIFSTSRAQPKETIAVCFNGYTSRLLSTQAMNEFSELTSGKFFLSMSESSSHNIPHLMDSTDLNIGIASFTNAVLKSNKSLRQRINNQCHQFKLFEDQLLACVSKKSPLAKLRTVSITDFEHFPVVMDVDQTLVEVMRVFNCEFKQNVLTTNDSFVFLDAISRNLAISIMPKLLVDHYPNLAMETAFVPLEEKILLQTFLLVNKKAPLTQGEQILVQHIKTRYESEGWRK